MLQQLSAMLSTLNTLASALIFGATVWFFFIQSPFLLKRLGRQRFVPIQMMLTKMFTRTLMTLTAILLGVAAVMTWGATADDAAAGTSAAMRWASVITAAMAFVAAAVNDQVVIPRALKAGGQSLRAVRGKDAEGTTTGFASEGVDTGTSKWHRLVVLCVVVMLGGTTAHLLL